MPERIWKSSDDGDMVPLKEASFISEDDLQSLIAHHPAVLDGEQMRPGDARRWMLISREQGIAQFQGNASRWAIDHVLVDQDAILTLVEVKRGDSPEVRRSFIGQLLEYAAHASETWSGEGLQRALENQFQGKVEKARGAVLELLQTDDEMKVEAFWNDVSRNLDANQIRLLFVSDRIPDELARVVEFLNREMFGIEVLAVEIKRFSVPSDKDQMLVPRVIGRTSATVHSRSESRYSTKEQFLEEFENEYAREVAQRLLEVTNRLGGKFRLGKPSVSLRMRCAVWKEFTFAWLHAQPGGGGWYGIRDFSFGVSNFDESAPEEVKPIIHDWITQFEEDDFGTPLPNDNVRIRAVSHEDAIEHQETLIARVHEFVSRLNQLGT